MKLAGLIIFWLMCALMGIVLSELNVHPSQWEFWAAIACVVVTRTVSSRPQHSEQS